MNYLFICIVVNQGAATSISHIHYICFQLIAFFTGGQIASATDALEKTRIRNPKMYI